MLFENGEQRYIADVVVMKLTKDMQHRSLSNRRGRRRVRPKQN
jgi:hypothetical protein